MLFIPKNSFMVSDFVRTEGPLKAFLFFFDEQTIKEFLKSKRYLAAGEGQPVAPYKMPSNNITDAYMDALFAVYKDVKATPDLLRIKLLELLNVFRFD